MQAQLQGEMSDLVYQFRKVKSDKIMSLNIYIYIMLFDNLRKNGEMINEKKHVPMSSCRWY
ncbi:hypothetical protein ScSA15_18150 [Streptococcus canis]